MAGESLVTKVMQAGSGTLRGEYDLPVGTPVEFKTSLGAHIQGQVACFDPVSKILAIKDTTTSKPVLRIFNLKQISDLKRTEGPHGDDILGSIMASTSQNLQSSQMAQTKMLEVMEEQIPIEGQRAFLSLRHILHNNVCWKGKNIVALDLVVVPPPYTSKDAYVDEKGDRAESALLQVQKILAKSYMGDTFQLQPCCIEEKMAKSK